MESAPNNPSFAQDAEYVAPVEAGAAALKGDGIWLYEGWDGAHRVAETEITRRVLDAVDPGGWAAHWRSKYFEAMAEVERLRALIDGTGASG